MFTAVMTMTAGTIFLMWLGEQIDEFGIGNGISLLIMAGILARMPGAGLAADQADSSAGVGRRRRANSASETMARVGDLVRGRRGRRGVHHAGPAPHSHAKRQARPRPARVRRHAAVPAAAGQSGRRDADHLRQQLAAVPLHAVSSAGRSLSAAFWANLNEAFHRGTSFIYNVLYVVLIYFFCYFWTAITFNPKDMADNLKNFGTFIPGYRPGKRTADYLEKVMVRITYVGAGFLAVVAIVPTIIVLRRWTFRSQRGQLLRRHRAC